MSARISIIRILSNKYTRLRVRYKGVINTYIIIIILHVACESAELSMQRSSRFTSTLNVILNGSHNYRITFKQLILNNRIIVVVVDFCFFLK
jgi:hypothetical protein